MCRPFLFEHHRDIVAQHVLGLSAQRSGVAIQIEIECPERRSLLGYFGIHVVEILPRPHGDQSQGQAIQHSNGGEIIIDGIIVLVRTMRDAAHDGPGQFQSCQRKPYENSLN